MPKTRSTKAAPAASKDSPVAKTSSKYTLESQSGLPPKVFILPTRATPEAQIVTLPNPRHAQPARYLVCPKTGIYEFTKIAAPSTTPRSWLIETASGSASEHEAQDGAERKAHVTVGADMYLATPIDPLFLLLPALAGSKASKGSDGQKRLFLSSDDLFDKLPEESSHLSEILRCQSTRALMEDRLNAVCDIVEAGDENMFRLNEKKLVAAVLEKAQRMDSSGLPPSMEENFVKKVLEAPILVQKREMTAAGTAVVASVDSGVSTPTAESTDSQSTTATAETASSSVSQPSTAASSFTEENTTGANIVAAIEASPEIVKLQRIRVAFNFICASYIAPSIADHMQASLGKKEEGNALDFSPLDDYLAKLAKLRAETIAARSMGDFSRKRGRDEEEDEARAEKKRKLEEDKKKKANESRAVRDLKKVNTTGMKKLSDFFKKK